MSDPSSLVIELVAGTVAVLVLYLLVWCALARRLRARAWGGVSGREGRGWIYRDEDRLVFVRHGRRYALPDLAPPHQAVRWSRRSEKRAPVAGYVFRDPEHLTHSVGFTDARMGPQLLAGSSAGSPRLGFRALVPRWTVPLGLVAVVTLGPLVPLGEPDTSFAWTDVVFGLGVLALLMTALVGAALAARRPAVMLSPVVVDVPGFDGSMPRDERHRAEQMPLYDLAVAVQRAEGHRDIEDNDQLLAPLRGLVRSWRMALVVRGLLTIGAVSIAVQAGSFWPLLLAVVMLAFTFGNVVRHPGLRALRNARNTSSPVQWRDWPLAAVWRRLDGMVFLCLFDRGGLVWMIRVDRVCAPGADVELSGELGDARPPAIRANGAWLLALEPPRRAPEWEAKRMRRELVDSLTTPPVGVPVRS